MLAFNKVSLKKKVLSSDSDLHTSCYQGCYEVCDVKANTPLPAVTVTAHAKHSPGRMSRESLPHRPSALSLFTERGQTAADAKLCEPEKEATAKECENLSPCSSHCFLFSFLVFIVIC